MAVYYLAGFDTEDVGAMSVAISGAVGSGTATITPGTYCHRTLAAVSAVSGYTDFATALDSALTAAVAGTWTVTWSSTTFLYTITRAGGVEFTLTWTGDAGTRLRRALGFSGTASSANGVLTGDVRPYYVIDPEIDARSQFSDAYEPDEIVEEAVADGGASVGIAKETTELYCDWTQACEPLAAVMSRSATSAVPWTYQHLWAHARGKEPIAVYGDSGASDGTVYKLRADGASFGTTTRERLAVDYDGLWNIKFRTRDLGRL